MSLHLRALALAAAAALAAAPASAAVISGLFNTGTDANNVALAGGNGVVDPHYQIIASSSPGFVGQQAVTYFNGAYASNDADSRWVSLSGDGSPGNNVTTYRLVFDLTGLDAATAEITGAWGADNLAEIFLNGANTGLSRIGFSTLVGFSIDSGFVSGLNTLDFRVTDSGPPTAFRIDNLAGTADLARDPGAVPEPATWAMMLLGFLASGSAIRARRRGLAVA